MKYISLKTLGIVGLIFLLVFNYFSWGYFIKSNDDLLSISFMDVGQGDGFIVRTPDGINLLVDAGPDSRMLDHLTGFIGVGGSLDIIMVSHTDSDHVGRIADIIVKYNVKKLIMNDYPQKSQNYTDLAELLKENYGGRGDSDLEVINVKSGDRFQLGCCVRVDILWPPAYHLSDLSSNDNSIAFVLGYREFKFFSGGDLGEKYENLILTGLLASNSLQSNLDLLKVGHHGSKTSSAKPFLAMGLPSLAIIQAGSSNSYGHPHQEVLDNLSMFDSKVLYSNTQNILTYRTNGYSYNLVYK